MHQKWVDFRLSHKHWRGYEKNRKHMILYSFYFREGFGLNGLAHHKNIWKPDIFLIKHGSYKVRTKYIYIKTKTFLKYFQLKA